MQELGREGRVALLDSNMAATILGVGPSSFAPSFASSISSCKIEKPNFHITLKLLKENSAEQSRNPE